MGTRCHAQVFAQSHQFVEPGKPVTAGDEGDTSIGMS